jgi:putative membrane protein
VTIEIHPAINAGLNLTSAILLVLALLAIRRGDRERHKRMILSAIGVSTVFLISYAIRFAVSGSHRYPGDGVDKIIYLAILFSHMILAVVLIPLVLRALKLGLAGRFDEHRRTVRFTWPIWMYVSVTGVIVYVMLYHVGPRI